MPETWSISIGGRVYGPYALEQMKAFHAGNRLTGQSLIARAGEQHFHAASGDPALAPLFRQEKPLNAGNNREHEPDQPHRSSARPEAETGTSSPSRFIIVADMKSGSIGGLDNEISKLGFVHRLTSEAWVLSSEFPINIVRNALVQKLGKIDTLFIVDAGHDKAAWFNFGPAADTRLRMMWSKPVHFAGPEKRTVKRA